MRRPLTRRAMTSKLPAIVSCDISSNSESRTFGDRFAQTRVDGLLLQLFTAVLVYAHAGGTISLYYKRPKLEPRSGTPNMVRRYRDSEKVILRLLLGYFNYSIRLRFVQVKKNVKYSRIIIFPRVFVLGDHIYFFRRIACLVSHNTNIFGNTNIAIWSYYKNKTKRL